MSEDPTFHGSYHEWRSLDQRQMWLHKAYPVIDRCPRCESLAQFEIKRNYPIDGARPVDILESAAYLCHGCEIILITARKLVELPNRD